jgi:hypothetical protein
MEEPWSGLWTIGCKPELAAWAHLCFESTLDRLAGIPTDLIATANLNCDLVIGEEQWSETALLFIPIQQP